MKKLFSFFLILSVLVSSNAVLAVGVNNSSNSELEKQLSVIASTHADLCSSADEFAELEEDYRTLSGFAYAENESLNITLEEYLENYDCEKFSTYEAYLDSYAKNLDSFVIQNHMDSSLLSGNGTASIQASGDSDPKWYYNIGTSLPQAATYSTFNGITLLSICKRGDILIEDDTITDGYINHAGIVEGLIYDFGYAQYYIRIIEAVSNPYGVCRGVFSDERVSDKSGKLYRVTSASSSKITAAINFAISQLGKSYQVSAVKNSSSSNPNWYCSELVWAAYYNQGIDLDSNGGTVVWPDDIKASSLISWTFLL